MAKLKIAIPNKGRLSENVFELLQRAGLNITKPQSRGLRVVTKDERYEVIFLRTQDIPSFVHSGIADVGFTGWDVVCESGKEVGKLLDLDFGYCEMVVAVKEDTGYTSSNELPNGIKVATSFVNISEKYFQKIGKEAEIIEVNGATEIAPDLGLADVIVDITSSGSTLKANKLKIIDKILVSTAVIISKPQLNDEEKLEVQTFIRAVNSAIAAKEKKYLMANLPKASLEEVKNFLPGLSSPTVSTLWGNDSEVAIHVVVNNDKVYESIDKLKQLGASGILIMTVDQMVP